MSDRAYTAKNALVQGHAAERVRFLDRDGNPMPVPEHEPTPWEVLQGEVATMGPYLAAFMRARRYTVTITEAWFASAIARRNA